MSRNPRVDKGAASRRNDRSSPPSDMPAWDRVLAHRPPASGNGGNGGTGTSREETAARFIATGVTPERVAAALADGGDALHRAAAASGNNADDADDSWAEPFGGLLAVALLAAEVSALTSHLNSRAAGVRSLAVDRLLDDLSAVTVAARLGVSRQKVYDVARGGLSTNYIDTVPWRQS